MRVVVAHPHRHHIYELLIGVSKATDDYVLLTPFYCIGWIKFLQKFPFGIGKKVSGYFHRDINPQRIYMNPVVAALKLSTLSANRKDISWFTKLFDYLIAKKISSGELKVDIFISLQDYMPLSVAAAKARKIKIISDQILNRSEDAQNRIAQVLNSAGLTYQIIDQSDNVKNIISSTMIFYPSNYALIGIERDDVNLLTHRTPYGVAPTFKPLTKSSSQGKSTCTKVAVRANTARKGGTLFLEALFDCQNKLIEINKGTPINIKILGSLDSTVESVLRKNKYISEVSIESVNVPWVKMPAFYSEMDFFVMPSLSEGRSLACLEAMMCSLPLVVTPYVGVDEFVPGEMGIEVPASVEGISNGMIEMLQNRSQWESWGQRAAAIAANATWSRYHAAVHTGIELLGKEG